MVAQETDGEKTASPAKELFLRGLFTLEEHVTLVLITQIS